MKFIDFFSGVGGFRRGMELAGHKCVGFCEFDKFAVVSYTAMHLMTEQEREYIRTLPKNKRVAEAGKEEYRHGEWYANDIRRIFAEDIPAADCWCFGFPCQDISVAGKQLGFNGTRSSLFFRVIRLVQDLEEKDRPTYLFIENVKNLLSVNGGTDFLKLLIAMDESGYDAEWQVINSADYVLQNRERVFIVGHLRGRSTKQIFPIEGTDGENCIQQIGNFMATQKRSNPNQGRVYACDGIAPCLNNMEGGGREPYIALPAFCDMSNGAGIQLNDTAFCLQSRYNKGVCNRRNETSVVCIPVLTPDRAEKRQNGRRMKEDGEPMFTLTGQDRHGIAVEVREATKRGYAECRLEVDSVNFTMPNSKTRRGRVGRNVANTLDTSCNQGIFVEVSEELTVYAVWYEKYQCYIAIRKLTPRECFRLQGWSDEYFDRAELVNSDSQLYKQAGNGVTVPVIYEIAKRMRASGNISVKIARRN